MAYKEPPYTITLTAADYLAKIVETATRLEYGTGFKRDIRLHRENRVRSIHSSLAIEGNTLSLNEVTAVIEGKIVAGRQEEIKEVKNAYAAYDKIMTFDPYSIADLLTAHKLMTEGLVKEAGMFRSGDVGVFDGDVAIHIGARPQYVPGLVEELFGWAKESELHPIIKSSVLHYEIEAIHPFADGNGRIGRLWQTLLLAKWNAIFEWIPMESVIYKNRPQYYKAIAAADKDNDSAAFIEFTLSALLDSVKLQMEHKDEHQVKHQVKHQVDLSDVQRSVLATLSDKALSRKEIYAAVGMRGDSRAFKRHIEPLIANGIVEMTIPNKPNSQLQKYCLTSKGKAALRGDA